MHPKFEADPNQKDGKGFYLLDRWPEIIGKYDEKKQGKFRDFHIMYNTIKYIRLQ